MFSRILEVSQQLARKFAGALHSRFARLRWHVPDVAGSIACLLQLHWTLCRDSATCDPLPCQHRTASSHCAEAGQHINRPTYLMTVYACHLARYVICVGVCACTSSMETRNRGDVEFYAAITTAHCVDRYMHQRLMAYTKLCYNCFGNGAVNDGGNITPPT